MVPSFGRRQGQSNTTSKAKAQPHDPTIADRASIVSGEEQGELLERVVQSSQLRRSTRLRDLLLYIGRQSIWEQAKDLREQDIGVAVFGRPEAYDTGQDNIVRVNATELRKRVETYFVTEGAHEQLVLHIPRGSYVLEFHRRGTEAVSDTIHPEVVADAVPDTAEQVAEPLADQSAPEVRRAVKPSVTERPASQQWLGGKSIAVLLCLLGWTGLLIQRTVTLRTSLQPEPNLKLFWAPLISAGEVTDIVLGDTSFALAEDISRRAIPLNDYVNLSYDHFSKDPALTADQKRTFSLILARNNGSFSDFRVARLILSMDSGVNTVQVRSAREYSPDLLKTRHVILVGSRKSDPWVDLFTPSLDFRVDYDPDRFLSYVENTHPATGEATRYEAPSDPGSSLGYSVIAFLPSLSAKSHLLIVAGTDSQATEAAGEFLTSEDSLNALRKRLGGAFPHFQLLLRTRRFHGTPLNAEVVALHVSPQ